MIKATEKNVTISGVGLEIFLDFISITTEILNLLAKEEEDTPEARAAYVKMLTNAFEVGIESFYERRKHAGTEENLQA